MLTFQAKSDVNPRTVARDRSTTLSPLRKRLPTTRISALLALFLAACSGGGSDPVVVTDSPLTGPKAGSLTVQPAAFSLSEGETVTLQAKLGSATLGASQVTWAASPASRATIDRNGNLTALKYGAVQVTARYTTQEAVSEGLVKAIPRRLETRGGLEKVGIVGRALGDSLEVSAVSTDGVPVPEVDIDFEVISGDGTVSAVRKATGPDGVARVEWILGGGAGAQELKASAGNLGDLTFITDALPDYDSSTVVLVDGDGQEGVVATYLPDELQARVTDQFGNPLPGLAVEWSFPGGSGAQSSSGSDGPDAASTKVLATTDLDGFTSMMWKLGTVAGDQEATVEIKQASGSSMAASGPQGASGWWRNIIARWRAWANAAKADAVQIDPEEVNALISESAEVAAKVVDAFGNEVGGGAISWRADNSGVFEIVAPGIIRGLREGRGAIFADDGTYNITGTGWVNIAARIASAIALYSGNGQTGEVGTTLPSPVAVRVVDQAGDPIPGAVVHWFVEAAGNGGAAQGAGPSLGPGQSGSETSYTNGDGIAETTWTLGTEPGQQRLQAQVDGVPPINLLANAVSGPAVIVEVEPAEFEVGTHQTYPLSASALDAYGNPVADPDVTWTTSDGSVATVNAGGVVTGVVEGTAQITAAVDQAVGYSSATVVAGGPEIFQVLDGSGQNGVVGAALPHAIRVVVQDGAGQPVSGIAVSWAVASGGGTLADEATMTGADGTASTVWTLGPQVGQQQVTAAIGFLPDVSFDAQAGPGEAASVTVSPSSATIQVGQTTQLSASARDGFGNEIPNPTVEWSSANTGVATVDGSGTVLGGSEGSATVRARVGSATGNATVTVQAGGGGGPGGEDEGIEKAGGDGQTGTVGTTLPQPLSVRAVNSNGQGVEGVEVIWRVETGGGSVSNSFSVTDGEGYAETHLTLGTQAGGNGVSASVEAGTPLVFSATGMAGPVAEIEVTPTTATIEVGQNRQFSATFADAYGNPANGSGVSWSSTNTGVASVTASGLATGAGAGSVQIRASAGGVTGTATLNVTNSSPSGNPGAVTDLTVVASTENSLTLQWTQTDDGTGNPSSYALRYGSPNLVWWEAYPTEVSIHGTGIGSTIQHTYSGLNSETAYEFRMVSYRGTLNVDATFGGLSNTAQGTTDVAGGGGGGGEGEGEGGEDVTSITVSPSTVSFTALEDDFQLSAVARNALGEVVPGVTIQWTSQNTSVAVVDQEGRVTSKGIGQALILASTALCQGCGSSDINVSQVADHIDVVPASFSLEVGQTQQLHATVLDHNGQVIQDPAVTWTSTNSNVATVSGDGFVVAQNSGDVDLVAEFESITGMSQLAVGQPVGSGEAVWEDGFEAGQLTNTGAYHWIGGEGQVNYVTNERARTGTHSLKFLFRGNPDDNADATSERRYELGESLGEVWFEYYVWVPENYTHRRPSGGPNNNKFFTVWDSGSYPGGGSGRLSVFIGTIAGDAGNSVLSASFSNEELPTMSATALRWSPGITDADKGRWNRVRIHVKVGTHTTGDVYHTQDWGDGLFELWWNGEKVISHAMPLFDPDDNAFRNGYVFGWSNSGFDEDTALFIDDWRVYKTNPGW